MKWCTFPYIIHFFIHFPHFFHLHAHLVNETQCASLLAMTSRNSKLPSALCKAATWMSLAHLCVVFAVTLCVISCHLVAEEADPVFCIASTLFTRQEDIDATCGHRSHWLQVWAPWQRVHHIHGVLATKATWLDHHLNSHLQYRPEYWMTRQNENKKSSSQRHS